MTLAYENLTYETAAAIAPCCIYHLHSAKLLIYLCTRLINIRETLNFRIRSMTKRSLVPKPILHRLEHTTVLVYLCTYIHR